MVRNTDPRGRRGAHAAADPADTKETQMLPKPDYVFWFATGSQDLYGDECLKTVAAHSQEMVAGLNASGALPFPVVWKPTLIDSVSIEGTLQAASDDPKCAGVILWMHTFSPAKMWIHGLQRCRKPLMHLHTQFNREIPFADIDMDFMNTNQSAHGDREFGHMMTRMGVPRKVAVGHWTDPRVQAKIASWMRTAVGVVESAHLRVVRFGDNMRDVAVTEGDKVEAELKFGWSVDAYDVSEMAKAADAVPAADVEALTDKYYEDYDIILEGRDPAEFRRHVAEQARIELGLRAFLDGHDYQAIVTNFQTLGGLRQLPGLAIQRLMADGYGFGAEGDWKTAAMVRLLKAMGAGIKDAKGSSFMEDYTYHLAPGAEAILQAHMLEVCPSIAAGRPAIKVDFLSMGEREDPARLVFTCKPGAGTACSLVDLGHRFRLIVNAVECLPQDVPMPKLPVASALWKPLPDLPTAAEAWIYAGGAHHTAFTLDLAPEQILDWGDAMGIETVLIDKDTTIRAFRNELRWNEAAYR